MNQSIPPNIALGTFCEKILLTGAYQAFARKGDPKGARARFVR